jgi:hypothetical protein
LRYLPRLAIVLCTLVGAMTVPSVASAGVADPISVTNWNSGPSGGCPVLTVIVGDCSLPPDAFQTGTGGTVLDPVDASVLQDLQIGTEVVPDPWWVPGLGTVTLGATAFAAGYEIGSLINAKWLHIDGAGLGVTTPQLPNIVWRQTNSWPGSVVPVGLLLAWGNANSAWAPFTDKNYGCGSTAENPYVIAYGNNAAASVPGAVKVTIPSTDPLYWLGCLASVHAPMYEVVVPKPQVRGVLRYGRLQPHTNQPGDYTSGWANPANGAGITSTAPAFNSGPANPQPCVYMSGSLVCLSGGTPNGPYTVPPQPSDGDTGYSDSNSNAIRHYIDPQHWAEPPKAPNGSEWTGTGGPEFTMPDCTGETVQACEADVVAAVAATRASFQPAFTEVAAPTYDPLLPQGSLVGTTPSAGAVSNPSSVQVIINQANPSGFCSGKAGYPHNSTSSAGVGPGMLIKGQVTCPFTGTVTVSLTLWKCSTKPSGTDAASIDGDPDCSVMKTCTALLPVQAYVETDPNDFVCATGEAPVGTSWYVGWIEGSQVLPNLSEIVPGTP